MVIRVRHLEELSIVYSIHVDNMLAATITLILHLFVGTLNEKWEITQSSTVGLE